MSEPARPEKTRSTFRRAAAGAFLTILTGAVALSGPGTAQAISGGQDTAAGEFGFIAEVHNTQVGALCTGTLINANWVLTARHCAEPNSVNDVTVRVGNSQRDTGGEVRKVVDIQKNPGYTGGHNDVALLRLSAPVTTVTPVRLAGADQAARWDGAGGDTGVAAGWGVQADGSFPGHLRKTSLSIRPTQIDNAGIPMIMVGPGPCGGDSGGPLLIRDAGGALVQAGVTKAANCGNGGDYSEVGAGPNRDWILNHVGVTSPAAVADWDGDGKQDMIARDNATGNLLMWPGRGVRGYPDPPVQIGNGWAHFTPFGVADWDNDGHQDLVARDDVSGDLLMYPGRGGRVYPAPPVRIGNGWGNATPFEVADWDHDGKQDIVSRNDITGDLQMFPGRGVRGYPDPPVRIGNGWRTATPFGIADWDRDGKQDLISRDNATGDLQMFPGRGVRGYPDPPVRVGNGWAGATLFAIADWDNDGKQDDIARQDASGDMLLWPGRGVRGYPDPPVRIGNGW